jgi:hypothetical protein
MHLSFTTNPSIKAMAFLTAAAIVPLALTAHARPAIDILAPLTSNTIDLLGKRLYSVADYWGDSSGRIDFTVTDTGQTMYVALVNPAGGFSIFYNGQDVPDDSTMAACSLGVTGAPVGCDLAYGETLLFTLEDLVNEEADPTELTIKCFSDYSSHRCYVTELDGSSQCYRCVTDGSGGVTCTQGCNN